MNRTNFTCTIGFIALWLLLLSPMPIQAIPDNTNDRPEDNRSLPFSLQQEGDVIYIFSSKEFPNLQIEIKDLSGTILKEEHIALPAQVSYPIYIGDLPMGDSYDMVIRQDGNRIVTYTIYK